MTDTKTKDWSSLKLTDLETRKKILMWARTPHASIINLQPYDLSSNIAHSKAPYNPMLARNALEGALHDGVITALLDETGGHAAQLSLDIIRPIATIDLRIEYIDQTIQGAEIHAKAHCHRFNNNIAFVSASAYHLESEAGRGETTVARAAITYMIGGKGKGVNRTDGGKQDLKNSDVPKPAAHHIDVSPKTPANTPYAQFLGIEETDDHRLVMRYSPKLIGNVSIPAIHGGVLGSFLEIAAAYETARRASGAKIIPITCTVNYLRTGKAMDVYAEVEIIKIGKRVATFEARAWQEDVTLPITIAYGHFLLSE